MPCAGKVETVAVAISTFPARRSGAEKEGIDADLLPLLDGCVEIPQQGQLRSLNAWHPS